MERGDLCLFQNSGVYVHVDPVVLDLSSLGWLVITVHCRDD